MTIDRQRLTFAAMGFLAEMRKRFIAMHPDRECPIRPLHEYSPTSQAALMAGIQKAISLAQPGADQAFAAWLEREAQKDPAET
jgi:hypothetical protein